MFRNDYSESMPKEIAEAVLSLGNEQNIGYGEDVHTARAKELIRKKFALPDADIHFLAGGTQTNMTVISFLLRPFEGAVCCDTGHINIHETAAVEGSGHKVYTVPNRDGKLDASDLEKAILLHSDEHMVKPKLVYVSDCTETGTVYTRTELLALRGICDKYGLYLFLDGARLGTALTSAVADYDCAFLGQVCDVFYIGGTKNGLLFGEAVVFPNPALSEFFRWHIKNRGAMLAKGFVVGAMFEALFTDNLFERLAENANRTAEKIRNGLRDAGVVFEGSSPSNQIFVRVKKELGEKIIEKFGCEKWSDRGTETVVRIVTSFATGDAECDELINWVKSEM